MQNILTVAALLVIVPNSTSIRWRLACRKSAETVCFFVGTGACLQRRFALDKRMHKGAEKVVFAWVIAKVYRHFESRRW
ncbi:MAG: hypothetical protein KME03_20355 [Aphanocapsa lilacina HA4352-LM1]|nr:hypothetical protein [Aphanocapsa lilacina HA4352-LM1]